MAVGVEDPRPLDPSLVVPPSSRAARALYAVAIPGVALFVLVEAGRLLSGTALEQIPLALAGALVGVALADLASATVHWACDTWGSSRTRFVGAGLIHAFRVHHHRPRAMLEHDALDVNGGASAGVLVVLVLYSSFFAPGDLSPGLRAGVLAFSVVAASANQLHYWAHAPRAPRWVRFAQRRGLLLSRAAHAGHHRAPHTDGYCISIGWLNRPLDALGWWRFLERVVEAATGMKPRGEASSSLAPDRRAYSEGSGS